MVARKRVYLMGHLVGNCISIYFPSQSTRLFESSNVNIVYAAAYFDVLVLVVSNAGGLV